MNKENVIKIAKYFKSKKIRVTDTYVMFNCPFAKALHKNRTDRNPSFSISVGNTSVFHCFSCNVSGSLRKLPSSLFKVYHKNFSSLQKFIEKHEGKELMQIGVSEEIEEIPKTKLDVFKPIDFDWYYIKKDILQMYDVRYYKGTIIFPIYNHRKMLLGIKYRNAENKLFFTEGKFKKYGAFFGMQFKLDKKDKLFVVEGERDVMLLKQNGIKNVWGLSGTPSNKQIEILKTISIPIVLFLDNDDAGGLAFDIIVSQIYKHNPYLLYISNYQGFKDPADICVKGNLETSLNSISWWIPNFSLTADG